MKVGPARNVFQEKKMNNFDRKDVYNRVTEHITLPLRHGGTPLRVVVLMPLRDDWASVSELIRRLDQAISSHPCTLDILVVDDASIQSLRPADFQSRFSVVRSIRVLHLRRNLGHQRAIAMGLVHIHNSIPCDAVLVMDSDGEDTADGALQLLRAFSGTTAVFAERSKRTEPYTFRAFYQLYKLLHRMLTGVRTKVGNFSILPSRYLGRLVASAELWNHYAAAVFRSGLPFTTTPIPRGYRITGTSKMNMVSLITHGMSAISVYGDIVGVRLFLTFLAGFFVTGAGVLSMVAIRAVTGRAIPGWTVYSMGALAIILIQLITVAASFTFTVLANRTSQTFVPLRDYELFVLEAEDIYRSPVAITAGAKAASAGSSD